MMRNKIELKKMIIINIVVALVFISLFALILYAQYKTYTSNFNEKVSIIFSRVLEQYPNIEKSDLIAILNDNESGNNELFRNYGINLDEDSAILENDIQFNHYIVTDIALLIIFFVALSFVFLKYNHNKDKKISEITRYIEEINKRNYKLDIEDNTEDELSILKNELYKTTVMLKEVADNSVNDKIKLKDSLSDISHQLKTPITSILIRLDNILDNKSMDETTRNKFIKDIKREVINIKFLVESILKLSKLDSNSVIFIQEKVTVKEIIEEAKQNVEMLGDLHNVKIRILGNDTDTIMCDVKWQVEAITNILKNAIEHSNENSKVDIQYEKNKVYIKIEIIDYGIGIDENDLPHVFDRFYKGINSTQDSIGIGLALSKSIIESNNGYIQVDSEKGKGSKFTIKYLL